MPPRRSPRAKRSYESLTGKGLPLVELHGDNPDGFAVLLSYKYEPERSVPTYRKHVTSVYGLTIMFQFLVFSPLRPQRLDRYHRRRPIIQQKSAGASAQAAHFLRRRRVGHPASGDQCYQTDHPLRHHRRR